MKKKIYITVSLIFALIGVAFTILPMGTLALLPIVPAIVFALLAMRVSDGRTLHASRLILFVAVSMLLIAIGKELFIKDEVVADEQFQHKKDESEKQTAKELEELEGLEQ